MADRRFIKGNFSLIMNAEINGAGAAFYYYTLSIHH